jgi:hypothetical protein
MFYNNVIGEHLGGGVTLFKNAITLDWESVISSSSKMINEEWEEMYSPSIHPETGKDVFINKSGFFFEKEDLERMPKRAGQIHLREDKETVSLLNFLEESRDRYLLKYLEMFPLAYKCIWWKVKGHILEYKKNVYLGSHSDTSVEYSYGIHTPDDQLPLRSVVTSLIYFNTSGSDYIGGEHYFNYLDIKYKPQKGDLIMFPSNYMAAHEVMPVKEGTRYSYLGWYSQGTPNENVKEYVADPKKDFELALKATNVYMPNLREDFRQYLTSNGHDSTSYAMRLTDGIGH